MVLKQPPAGYTGLIGIGDFFMKRILQQQEFETCGRLGEKSLTWMR